MNECGWIIESESPEQFAETIQCIFDHPTEAAERGLKAREKCRKEYTWDAIEKGLVNVFGKYE